MWSIWRIAARHFANARRRICPGPVGIVDKSLVSPATVFSPSNPDISAESVQPVRPPRNTVNKIQLYDSRDIKWPARRLILALAMSLTSTWCGVNLKTNATAAKCFSETLSNLCQIFFKTIWNNFCLNKCLMMGKCSCGNSIEIISNAATAALQSVGCSSNSMSCKWKFGNN